MLGPDPELTNENDLLWLKIYKHSFDMRSRSDIFSAAKPRSRHRALSKWGVFYELGVLRRFQASIQFV